MSLATAAQWMAGTAPGHDNVGGVAVSQQLCSLILHKQRVAGVGVLDVGDGELNLAPPLTVLPGGATLIRRGQLAQLVERATENR